MDKCYAEYKKKHLEDDLNTSQKCSDSNYLEIVSTFYEKVINEVAKKLNVFIIRKNNYSGGGRKITEKIKIRHSDVYDVSSECITFNILNTKYKQLESNILHKEFNRIVKIQNNDNALTQLKKPKQEYSILIDDDDIILRSVQSGVEQQPRTVS